MHNVTIRPLLRVGPRSDVSLAWMFPAHTMKACTVLVISCVLIMSSAQQNVTTEQSNVVTQAQKTTLDAESVGEECIRNEQCIKTVGKNAECKMGTCVCKRGTRKSSDGLNCETEKSFAVHNMAHVTCFALIAIVNTAM